MTAASKPRSAGKTEQEGRWAKARQFAAVCDLIEQDALVDGELGDVYVTLAVRSGIASSDVICIATLGGYWANGNHDQAVQLLKAVDKQAAAHMKRLLSLKTKAGYSHTPASAADVKIAKTAHRALLATAQLRRS